ncbi:glycine cleavage T C-terminal barrel domain-containing protein [Fulvimarina sp. 2208YS6-2-32]|uniref:Glycine cleavage T C-terminal barrel domain-containing protein n=1 Tax=Fulvimarina uroteuthidis TaxID=3098149 RepID=A0ABU5I175_9HYPH|nr:glycine cleavage T C-terminal barrel domain-containing protein [Fulvimarina sp. 2208YS6-2-32]MDY8108835.1 glycine cleavage T C-terminal barrel domain-containing protein [Fulvimarina sp. 2208YS6-2-32]
MAGAEPIGHGDGIYCRRARIGTVTSAAKSPLLKATVALARLDAGTGDLGDAVEIGKLDGHRKRIAATIVPFPFYDPKKTRVRADWAAQRP